MQKLSKLTSTAYSLVDFFPDTDPLKNKAKEKLLEIMEKPSIKAVDQFLSLLFVAKAQGWISCINCLILNNEFEQLKSEMSQKQSKPEIASSSRQGGIPRNGDSREKFSERQEKIVHFLQENEKAQVMDLQRVLGSVTKRTIRRDLDELLRVGKIARFGEFNQVVYKIN